jgi:hypothetical protein
MTFRVESAGLADAAGGVFLAPQDASSDWAEIGVNYPIISGDNVWASAGGRAEVDYGGGQFRLAGATNIHVSRLDDRQLALFVAEGAVILRVRALDPGDVVRIDAPTAQVQIARPGLYRIDVVPDQLTTTLTVREGEALVSLQSALPRALRGRRCRSSARIRPSPTAQRRRRRRLRRVERRSRSLLRAQSLGGVRVAADGRRRRAGPIRRVADLSGLRRRLVPHAVPYGWAPYADGYWINVGPWGATWVDAAPWGYAPSHYGRWAWIGGRWGWCPGGYVARPIWAPALVAWRGGPGWGLSASYGTPVYGWVPLGWRDPYIPPWNNCSSRCWTLYNQPYGVALRERPRAMPTTWSNLNVPGAVTAVPGHALTASRSIASERIRVPVQTASAAPALASAPTMPPMRTRTPASTINAALPAGGRKPAARPIAQRVRPPDGAGHDAQLERECADRKRDDGSRRPRAPDGRRIRQRRRPTRAGCRARVRRPRMERQRRHSGTTARGSIVLPRAAVRRQRGRRQRTAMPSPRPERVAPAAAGGQPGMPMPSGMVVAPAPAGVPAAVPVAPQGAVVAPGTPVHRARSGRQGSGTRERFARPGDRRRVRRRRRACPPAEAAARGWSRSAAGA